MARFLSTLFLILLLGSCDRSHSDQSEQSASSTNAEPSSADKKQSHITLTVNDTTYDFIIYGRCAGGPHYNFWGIKPEFINTTGRGPRVHLIGGPEETVIKFYQNDQQQFSTVLTGDKAVPYLNGQMHIITDGKDNIDLRVNCQQSH